MQEMYEMWVQSLLWEDPLEKEIATHSSILAWKIAWAGEPGKLQSIAVAKSQTGLSIAQQQAIFTERVRDWFSLIGLLVKLHGDTAHSVSEKLNLNETWTI